MTIRRFERLSPPAHAESGLAYWLLFLGDNLLFLADGPPRLLDGLAEQAPTRLVGQPELLGLLDGRPLLYGVVAGDATPAGLRTVGLRALLAEADAELAALAGYAAQLVHWERTSGFCPACGRPTRRADGWGKTCTACGHTRYPLVSPVAIVLIHDGGDRVLLTTKPGWGPRYSLVAGFVEPGESAEACALREVREEVGVELTEVCYVGSQPWPFPHQLMLGFTARYAGGDIVIDTSELADARWFSLDALPPLPPPFSIARQIIEDWLARRHA